MPHCDPRIPASPAAADPKWLLRATWARWMLLGFYLVLTFVWYWATFATIDPVGFRFQVGNSELISFVVATAGLFGLQVLLLLGAPHLHWPRPRRKRSMFVSLAAGSAIAMLLTIGIGAACMSLYKLIHDPASFHAEWAIISPTAAPSPFPPPPRFNWRTDIPWDVIGIVLITWTFWLLVFTLMGGAQWTHRFRRMYRTLSPAPSLSS